jgi:hypothetical protein
MNVALYDTVSLFENEIEESYIDFNHLFTHSGLPDGIFSHQNPNLDQSWRVLQWKMLVYLMDFWSILLPFDIFQGH